MAVVMLVLFDIAVEVDGREVHRHRHRHRRRRRRRRRRRHPRRHPHRHLVGIGVSIRDHDRRVVFIERTEVVGPSPFSVCTHFLRSLLAQLSSPSVRVEVYASSAKTIPHRLALAHVSQ